MGLPWRATSRGLALERGVNNVGPMAVAAKEALGRDDLHANVDKGYFSGTEILACHEVGITTTVPRPATSGNEGKGMFVKADFLYDPERDVYRCPAGNKLTRSPLRPRKQKISPACGSRPSPC